MSWDGFGGLDLSGVQGETGSARLPVGSYLVKCTDAEIKPARDPRNKMVRITLACENGNGDIINNFNVVNASAKAQEIGLSQLKGFLEVSGHPNPDKPSDIKSLVGLRCVIMVGHGNPYTDDKGNQRQGTEVKKFMPADAAYSGPNAAAPAAPQNNGGGSKPSDDEIPF